MLLYEHYFPGCFIKTKMLFHFLFFFFFFFFLSPQVHCGGTLRADSGEIQTPNFPFHYPRRTDCQWKIVVSGSSITLNFEEFEVQWDVQMMLRRSALQIVSSAWKQQSLHHVTHQILPLLITQNYRQWTRPNRNSLRQFSTLNAVHLFFFTHVAKRSQTFISLLSFLPRSQKLKKAQLY